MKISSIAPRQIPSSGGTIIHVTGSGFEAKLRINVGGVPAGEIQVADSSSLHFAAPAGKIGYADLELIGGTTVVQKKALQYVAPPAPVIHSVTPKRGPTSGMIDVRIEGEHFSPASQVLVHGKRPLSIILIDEHTLEIMPPAGTDGEFVDITVKNPDGAEVTVKRAFQYDNRFGSSG